MNKHVDTIHSDDFSGSDFYVDRAISIYIGWLKNGAHFAPQIRPWRHAGIKCT